MSMTSLTIILVLLLKESQRKRLDIQTFRDGLTLLGRQRRNRRIRRRALQHPKMFVFPFLFGSGCHQSLIALTGFDFKAFHYMLSKFTSAYNNYSPYSENGKIRLLPNGHVKRERPRSMTATQLLVSVLTLGRSRRSDFVLSLIFGITGSVCSLFLRFEGRILMKFLQEDRYATVKMPSPEELTEFKLPFSTKYSISEDFYFVADGLKLYLEQTGDCVIQNMFYNAWTMITR